ncbi:hypothetical protein GGR53DRAFT_502841 [Hypoxylon sp. FL1150]|nr:hypothetical protein GGR53DRAFT_502841 [Hypoxylon sp. FL1150]
MLRLTLEWVRFLLLSPCLSPHATPRKGNPGFIKESSMARALFASTKVRPYSASQSCLACFFSRWPDLPNTFSRRQICTCYQGSLPPTSKVYSSCGMVDLCFIFSSLLCH